jgi:hypothetical protein
LQVVDWGKPNERTLYRLPGDQSHLMMLLRTGGVRCYCSKTPCPGTSTCPGDGYAGAHMLASTCVLSDSSSLPVRVPSVAHTALKAHEQQHVCRPGTGLYNTGLPGDRMPPSRSDAASTPATIVQADVGGEPWPGKTHTHTHTYTHTHSLSSSLLSFSQFAETDPCIVHKEKLKSKGVFA